MAWYKHKPTDLGWFWRGTQSAIFFYVSCAPCFMHSAKKKQRRENKRAMAERVEQMRLADGMFYAQPLPFQTNEAWRSEIELGPERPLADDVIHFVPAEVSSTASTGHPSTQSIDDRHRPPSSRQDAGDMTKDSTRKEGNSPLQDKSKAKKEVMNRSTATPEPNRKATVEPARRNDQTCLPTAAEHPTPSSTAASRDQPSGPSSSTGGASLSSTVIGDGHEHIVEQASLTSGAGSKGKLKRYQRPPEPLWGITDGFGPREILHGFKEPEPVPAWYVKRNPEVNDLHPPVVSSLPKSKKDALWMLQPPPPAAFMEGRVVQRERRRATSDSTHESIPVIIGPTPPVRRGRINKGKQRRSGAPRPSRSSETRPKRRPAPLPTFVSDES